MKKFNLKEALAGEPLITRDGRKVSGFKYSPSQWRRDFPYLALIEGEPFPNSFTKNGKLVIGVNAEEDLFMAESKKEKEPFMTCGNAPWNVNMFPYSSENL